MDGWIVCVDVVLLSLSWLPRAVRRRLDHRHLFVYHLFSSSLIHHFIPATGICVPAYLRTLPAILYLVSVQMHSLHNLHVLTADVTEILVQFYLKSTLS